MKKRWVICSQCGGEGKSSAYLGSFTAEEFSESFSPEEQEDYVRGKYDRQCTKCGGTGKVDQAAIDRWTQRRNQLYEEWVESGCPEGSFSAWSGL